MKKLLILLLFVINSSLCAEPPSPEEFILGLQSKISAVRSNDVQVKEIIARSFASDKISRFIIGKFASQLKTEEKQKIAKEYERIMLSQYASLVTSHLDYKIKITDVTPFSSEKLMVKTLLVNPASDDEDDRISVDYQLLTLNGSYKITDISVNDISLVMLKRHELDEYMQDGTAAETITKLRRIK